MEKQSIPTTEGKTTNEKLSMPLTPNKPNPPESASRKLTDPAMPVAVIPGKV